MTMTLPVPSVPEGPRERALEFGVSSLGDGDLLAVLLGTGAAGRHVTLVAASLLQQFQSLEVLARMGPAALAEHPGLGHAKALRLAAAVELGRRVTQRSERPKPPIRTPEEAAGHVAPALRTLDHEEMWVLSLDGRNRLRGARRVAQGGLHGCSVSPRDVLRAALLDGASAFVLVHNHPSGDPTPSADDVHMTIAIARAGLLAGVGLADHVIVSPDGTHTSMLAMGVLDRL